MKITRDVVTDLLPVYLAGEASNDTSALIDEFIKQDLEFANLLAEQKAPLAQHSINIPKEIEMQTLQKTKKLLGQRSLYLGFAIFFSLFTIAFRFDPGGIHWIWEGAPIPAIVCLVVGSLMWAQYAGTNHKLSGSDL